MSDQGGASDSPWRKISLLPASVLDWIFAGALFLLALGLALYQNWSKAELFWAVWIASFAVVGVLLMTAHLSFAIMGVRYMLAHRLSLGDFGFGLAVFLTALAASAMPLGGIYWFTSGFVSSALLSEPHIRFGPSLIMELLKTYWPLVLAGLAARAMDLFGMLDIRKLEPDDKIDALVDMMRMAAFSSAGFFVATFVYVFAVLITRALELEPGWWLFSLVFAAFYILPARPLPPRQPDRAESVMDETVWAELSAMFREPALNLQGRQHRYPDYRSLYASPEFSRYAEALRFAGEEQRLKDIQTFLTQKVIDERKPRNRQRIA